MRIRLNRHIEKHLQSLKTKMNKPTGYKQSTNLQAKWPRMSVISEEVRASIMSRLEIAARHHSHSHPGEPRTSMIRIAARHHSHSHPGEPRTGMISRLELQQGTTATHFLESQEGQA